MGRAGRVFAQPVTVQVGGFSTRNRPITVTDLSVRVAGGWWLVSGETDLTGILRNAARSCQIHPRSDEIPSDPVRFFPNRDEKSLVWLLDPVFIVPKIDKFKWKGAGIWKNGRILHELWFRSGFTGIELKNR